MCGFLLAALRVSVSRWERKKNVFWTICYLMAPSDPPSLCPENYEQWAALTFLRTAKGGGASAPVLSQWQRRAARSYLTRPTNGARLPGSHDAFLCVPSPLSAQSRRARASLKTWHRWNRTSSVHGRSDQVLSYENLMPSEEAEPSSPWGWPCLAGETRLFPPAKPPERRRGETITPRSYWNGS